MIAAATLLFARSGFNGVTTRDIARSARVSEGNIFRYFPSKRDLFVAVIDTQLGKLRSRAEMVNRLLEEDDAQIALRGLFDLIAETVIQQPQLVRLLHFSVLEFGPDLEPVYRRHFQGLLAMTAANFEQWSNKHGFRSLSSQVTVMAFVATVLLLQSYPLFTGAALPVPPLESAAAEYAELWYRVLSREVEAGEAGCKEERAGALGD